MNEENLPFNAEMMSNVFSLIVLLARLAVHKRIGLSLPAMYGIRAHAHTSQFEMVPFNWPNVMYGHTTHKFFSIILIYWLLYASDSNGELACVVAELLGLRPCDLKHTMHFGIIETFSLCLSCVCKGNAYRDVIATKNLVSWLNNGGCYKWILLLSE